MGRACSPLRARASIATRRARSNAPYHKHSMKTPREILLQRHQAIELKLDTIRAEALKTGLRPGKHPVSEAATIVELLRDFFWGYRMHFAAMAAIWFVIVLLNLNVGHSTSLAAAIPSEKIPPPQIIMASLRENRRELLEMIQPLASSDARPSTSFPPQPRSERPRTALMV